MQRGGQPQASAGLRQQKRNWWGERTCALAGLILNFTPPTLIAGCLGAVWRIVTSALTHSSLLHLAFNLMALVPLAQSLERTLGTLQLGSIVLALMLTQPLLFITLAYALAAT